MSSAYNDFISIVEEVSSELYSDNEWQACRESESSSTAYRSMLESVYQTAFERNPTAFKGIQWVNSDDGLPVWIRPGINWTSS